MELASLFYYSFCMRHGIPHEILSDNGPPFGSSFITELAKFTNISILFSPAHHPESNGLVERFMKTMKQMILVYVHQEEIVKKWDVKLKIIRFTYNNMYHSSLHFSPFELVHGRMARTPIATIDNNYVPPQYRNTDTPQAHFAKALSKELHKAFQIVWDHQNQHTQNNLNNNPTYEIGQKIWVFNYKLSSQKHPRKFMYNWIGPFTITEKLSNTRFNITNDQTKKPTLNVHIDVTKPYIQQQELV